MGTKINSLLKILPPGMVATASWLHRQGFSKDLQKKYRDSEWLKSIGNGAMIRYGTTIDYSGAVAALQYQQDMSIHPGGKTALSFQGLMHFLDMSTNTIILFGKRGEKLPHWFKNYNWGVNIKYYTSSFLPAHLGIKSMDTGNFAINISSPARALMECLYLVPLEQDMEECMDIMVGLNNIRPNEVQDLLEACTSVKVKRLFLYMAEKCRHQWYQRLNLSKINLGSGKRSIIPEGIFIKKYGITVIKHFENDQRGI